MLSHGKAELIHTTAVGLINAIVFYERGGFKAWTLIAHAVSIMKTNGDQILANGNVFLNTQRHMVLIYVVPYGAEKNYVLNLSTSLPIDHLEAVVGE